MKHEPLLKVAPFSGSRVQPFDGTRRYLSTGDLQEATTSFVEVTYADKPSRADISVRPGDVLFARMKGTKKVLEIDRSLADIIVSTGFAVLRPTEQCKGKYLSIYLKSGDFERQKEKYCSGAIQPAITNAGIKNITIPFPPLDDQKRIAHLLGKVEGLIARRKQHLQQLDDLLKSVFWEMFGEFLKDDSDSTLADCLKIQQGFAFKSTEFIEYGIPIIKIGTVNKGFFDYSTLSFIAEDYPEKVGRYEIVPGDLLISLTGTVGKDDYGNTCFVPKDSVYPTYLLNQRVGKLICHKDVANPYFIDAFMTLPKVKAALIKQNRGVRQANLSNSDVYNIHLSIPPIDLQNQFAAIVEKVEGLKSRYQQSLADLESLYGALSQKAFKGELDLSRVVIAPYEEKEGSETFESDIPTITGISAKPPIELPTPAVVDDLHDAKGRMNVIGFWLDSYLEQFRGMSFSAQDFLERAQQKLWELLEDDAYQLSVSEYDYVKDLVFQAIENGRLSQNYDDANNQVQITAARG